MPPTSKNTEYSEKQFYVYLTHSLHKFVDLDHISH